MSPPDRETSRSGSGERVHTSPPPPASPGNSAERSEDLTDAAWLYAWSRQALRPAAESLAARVTAPGRAPEP